MYVGDVLRYTLTDAPAEAKAQIAGYVSAVVPATQVAHQQMIDTLRDISVSAGDTCRVYISDQFDGIDEMTGLKMSRELATWRLGFHEGTLDLVESIAAGQVYTTNCGMIAVDVLRQIEAEVCEGRLVTAAVMAGAYDDTRDKHAHFQTANM